jgi:outer membrane immunogenic protein
MENMHKLGTALLLSSALVGSASAADLPVKAPPVPYVQTFDWSSIYLEAGVGWAGSNQNNTFEVPFLNAGTSQGTSFSGLAGGGGIGAQKEFGGVFVFGVDARIWDIASSGQVNTALATGVPATLQNSANLLYLGLVSLGLPFGPDGSWLFSVEGGVAANKSGVTLTAPGIASAFQNNGWNAGWAVGVKLEKAWTLAQGFAFTTGLEYLHVDDTGIGGSLGVIGTPVLSTGSSNTMDYFGANFKLLFNGSSRT